MAPRPKESPTPESGILSVKSFMKVYRPLDCHFTTDEKKKVLEQLPLTLQRAFILIRELDDQAQCEFSALEYFTPGLTNGKPTARL